MRRHTHDDRHRRQRHDELRFERPARPIERTRLPPRPSLLFSCEFCPRRFADLDTLVAHREAEHP